jgi:hypothetical protein
MKLKVHKDRANEYGTWFKLIKVQVNDVIKKMNQTTSEEDLKKLS